MKALLFLHDSNDGTLRQHLAVVVDVLQNFFSTDFSFGGERLVETNANFWAARVGLETRLNSCGVHSKTLPSKVDVQLDSGSVLQLSVISRAGQYSRFKQVL